MAVDFSSIFNHHEREIFAEVLESARRFPDISTDELLADVACVALNRLPPRYIRHEVDFAYYLTEKERNEVRALVSEAVDYAFSLVRSRLAKRSST
jgi:hypothetical protein